MRPLANHALPLSGLLLCGLLLPACSNTAPAAPPGDFGDYGVGFTTTWVVDDGRDDRTLPLAIWYPAATADDETPPTPYRILGLLPVDSTMARQGAEIAQGAFPLIVFSHGYPSFNLQSAELMELLASHGYIVVAPDHVGSTALEGDSLDSFEVSATHRVPDISFVIDEVLAMDEGDGLLSGSVDENAIAVVGNSWGGSTAMGVAAGWGGAASDPRVRAVVPISGVISEVPWFSDDFTPAELSTVTIPTLLVGGTEDDGLPPSEHNGYAFEALTSSEAVYRVDVVGATHYHFSGFCALIEAAVDAGLGSIAWDIIPESEYASTCLESPYPFSEATRLTSVYTVAFLKTHLEGDRRYAEYLTTAYADTEAEVLFWSRVRD